MGRLESISFVKEYRKAKVVDGINLKANTGEVIGLPNPNGAGKTTAFSMIAGLVKPDKGIIMLDGKDITRLPMHVRGRLETWKC